MKVDWSGACDMPISGVFTAVENCRSLYPEERTYAVSKGFTLADTLDICYVDDGEWYYKGEPTCVGASNSFKLL